MRIKIKGEGRAFGILLPTGLIFNAIPLRIVNLFVNRYTPETAKRISPEGMDRLSAELRRFKKTYGKWKLVEIRAEDGSEITVEL